jgi:hypothetical protein
VFLRCSRAFILIAIATLFANAYCFGNCASDACGSPKTSSSGCHHQKSPDKDSARCSHQHSEFAGPETGIAKVTMTTADAVPAAITVDWDVAPADSHFASPLDTGPSPGKHATIFVLRI